MKIIAPDYYNEFSCIADKCRHNCCIGWEIDIDEETLAYYKDIGGSFGKRLKEGICENDDGAYFRLSESERCPFLNSNNLCDIITELGEDKLCGICTDHPRYRNFYSDRVEIGLGMCCEEAARLILTRENKTKLIVIENNGVSSGTDEEEKFFAWRNNLIQIAQNRRKSVNERMNDILHECNISFPQRTIAQWADIFLGLERLDSLWTDMLNRLKFYKVKRTEHNMDLALEQLAVYMLLRHLPDALYDRRYKARAAFAVLSVRFINAMCTAFGGGIDELIETARMYSAEIEYSEENTEALLEMLDSN